MVTATSLRWDAARRGRAGAGRSLCALSRAPETHARVAHGPAAAAACRPSDVLQDAYLDASRRLNEYLADPSLAFYLWLRLLTGQRLMVLHRHHLGAKMRDAGQEVSLYRGALPQATSLSLAAQLLGRLTSPTKAVARAEMQIRVQHALNEMEPIDREIIALRHFEELTNNKVAHVLGIKKAAASNRYIRALKRLKQIMSSYSGMAPD